MNVLDFIASIVASLAWPATLVALLLLFKGSVRDGLAAMLRLRYKDFEVEFARRVQEVQDQIDILPESAAPPADSTALSVRSWRTSRQREAPRAIRTLSS